jgi:hypothetical protein
MIVVNPWSCLDANNESKTAVLYLDSLSGGPPLATRQQVAMAIMDMDAIRERKAAGYAADPCTLSDVEARIEFQIVDVRSLLHAAPFVFCQLTCSL